MKTYTIIYIDHNGNKQKCEVDAEYKAEAINIAEADYNISEILNVIEDKI